jgi:CheY-like chemotaxis protein
MNNSSSNQKDDNKHILVVDDFIDNTLVIGTILELEGYQVDVADNGYTAISKIEANPPIMVILDLMMPELDGIEVAQWIRKNQPSVLILLFTAHEEIPVSAEYKPWVDAFIRKPVNVEDFLKLVRGLLPKEALNQN